MQKLGIRNKESEFYPLFSLGKKRKITVLLRNIWPNQTKGFIEFFVGEHKNCQKNNYIGQIPFYCKNEFFDKCELDIIYVPDKYLKVIIRGSGNDAIKVVFSGISYLFKNSKKINLQLNRFFKSLYQNVFFRIINALLLISLFIFLFPFLLNFFQYPLVKKKYIKINTLKIQPLQSHIYNLFSIKKFSDTFLNKNEFLSDVLLNNVKFNKSHSVDMIPFIDGSINKFIDLSINPIVNQSIILSEDNSLKIQEEKIIQPFKPLLFHANQSKLLSDDEKRLREIINKLKSYDFELIKIIGHTANFGIEKNKLLLSRQRAKVIFDYFINSNDFKPDNFEIIGKGAIEPIAPNFPETEAEKNRRVEIHIIAK